MLDEICNGHHISCLDTSHVHQRLRVGMTFQETFEEWASSREDHLFILTYKGDISEVSVIPELFNRGLQKILKVVPLQT